MPELRKDPVTAQWVIIRTERPYRPEDFRPVVAAEPPPGPCVLCSGHEQETPAELLAYRAASDGRANGPGWSVRVVPSKFPTLRIEGDLERRGHGLYDLMNGIGAHELIVESPRHDDTLATLSVAALEHVVHAFQERILDLRRDTRLRSVVVFRPGRRASLPGLGHPHSELLATPSVAPDLSHELHHARSYFEYRERCLFCDILQQEADEGRRLVVSSEHTVALVPFAARSPFEVWFVPRRHLAGFESVMAQERRDLARTMRSVLQRLRTLFPAVPIAFVLHSAPFGEGEVPYFHWHLEMTPLVAVPGFLGDRGGFPVNPLPPEDAATFLRSAAE